MKKKEKKIHYPQGVEQRKKFIFLFIMIIVWKQARVRFEEKNEILKTHTVPYKSAVLLRISINGQFCQIIIWYLKMLSFRWVTKRRVIYKLGFQISIIGLIKRFSFIHLNDDIFSICIHTIFISSYFLLNSKTFIVY